MWCTIDCIHCACCMKHAVHTPINRSTACLTRMCSICQRSTLVTCYIDCMVRCTVCVTYCGALSCGLRVVHGAGTARHLVLVQHVADRRHHSHTHHYTTQQPTHCGRRIYQQQHSLSDKDIVAAMVNVWLPDQRPQDGIEEKTQTSCLWKSLEGHDSEG